MDVSGSGARSAAFPDVCFMFVIYDSAGDGGSNGGFLKASINKTPKRMKAENQSEQLWGRVGMRTTFYKA